MASNAEILSQDLGRVQGISKQGIAYNSGTIRTAGFAELGNAVTSYIQAKQIEEEKERRERVATDKLKGEVLQQSGTDIEQVQNPTQRQAYNASKFRSEATDGFRKITQVFDSSDFQDLSKEAKSQQYRELQESFVDNFARYDDLQDDETSLTFLRDMLTKMDTQYESATYKHENITLPKRTIGIEADNVIKSRGDADTWSTFFTAVSPLKGGLSEEEYLTELVGHASRALRTDNIEAYDGLHKSGVYEKLSTETKKSIDGEWRSALLRVENKQVDTLVGSIKQSAQLVAQGGSPDAMFEGLKAVSKLQPHLRTRVLNKVEDSVQKAQKLNVTLTKKDLALNHPEAIALSEDEIEDAFEVDFRAEYSRVARQGTANGNAVPVDLQDVNQAVALKYAKAGMYPSKAQASYDLVGGGMVDGVLNPRTAKAITGLDNLYTAGLREAEMTKLAGDKNYEIYENIRNYREQGFPVDMAYTYALRDRDEFQQSSKVQKTQKLVEDMDAIDNSGVIDNLVNAVSGGMYEVFTLGGRLEYAVGLTGQSGLEGRLDENVSLFTEAPLTQGETVALGSPYTTGIVDTLSNNNKMNLMNARLQYAERKGALKGQALTKAFKKKIEEESLIINQNVVLDDDLYRKYVPKAGDAKQASKILSGTFQMIAPIMALPQDARARVLQDVMDITRVDPQTGNRIEVTDPNERFRMLETKPDGVDIRVNFDKYKKMFDESVFGGKSLAEVSRETLGFFDSGEARNTFTAHTVTYVPESKSYHIRLLNRDGEFLREGATFFDDKADDPEGSPVIHGQIPDEFIGYFFDGLNNERYERGVGDRVTDWFSSKMNTVLNTADKVINR